MKYIHKIYNDKYKKGFLYRFRVREGDYVMPIKASCNLKKLVAYRDEWLQLYRPDLFEKLKGRKKN